MEVNKCYNLNCIELMQSMGHGIIDLTVTSPPYDNLRKYNGFDFDFENVAKLLFEVTKKGGIVVWVVGDQVVNGSETGTSFKQALYFMQLGFKLHDTMIYEKTPAFPSNEKSKRYSQSFEYMFVFSKGDPVTVNLLKDRKNKWGGTTSWSKTSDRGKDGKLNVRNVINVKDYGYRFNIWKYATGRFHTTLDDFAYQHPAMFPEQLAADHILSWSNETDLIFDPFAGSGTTLKMAHLLNRKFIGAEISKEYCEIIEKRLAPHLQKIRLF